MECSLPLAAIFLISMPKSEDMAPSTEKMATEAMRDVMKSNDDTMNASMCT